MAGFFRRAARALAAYQPQAIVGRVIRGDSVKVDLDEQKILDSGGDYLLGGASVAGGVFLGVGASNIPWSDLQESINPLEVKAPEPPPEPTLTEKLLTKQNLTIAAGTITVIGSLLALKN